MIQAAPQKENRSRQLGDRKQLLKLVSKLFKDALVLALEVTWHQGSCLSFQLESPCFRGAILAPSFFTFTQDL